MFRDIIPKSKKKLHATMNRNPKLDNIDMKSFKDFVIIAHKNEPQIIIRIPITPPVIVHLPWLLYLIVNKQMIEPIKKTTPIGVPINKIKTIINEDGPSIALPFEV